MVDGEKLLDTAEQEQAALELLRAAGFTVYRDAEDLQEQEDKLEDLLDGIEFDKLLEAVVERKDEFADRAGWINGALKYPNDKEVEELVQDFDIQTCEPGDEAVLIAACDVAYASGMSEMRRAQQDLRDALQRRGVLTRYHRDLLRE